MAEAVSRVKDSAKVRAGRIGAEVRWRRPRVVHLEELSGEQRRLVLALIEAARKGADR